MGPRPDMREEKSDKTFNVKMCATDDSAAVINVSKGRNVEPNYISISFEHYSMPGYWGQCYND